MIQTLIVVLTILVNSNWDKITPPELYELHTLDSTHHYYGDNWDFEDGSYIRTTFGRTVAGCRPFHLCSWVGIDTSWEDILNETDSEYMYKIVRLYQNAPEKFKLFAGLYR